jgi:hypothetical protein
MNGPVRLIEHTPGMGVPADEQRFLDELEGPVVIKVAGRRPGPGRVVGGLLHGNEPSGLRAIHRYLCELDPARLPATDTWFFLGAVEAARLPPRLSRRRLPDGLDLNRCFRPPFAGREGEIARATLEILRPVAPEAVLDLHNNTGRNPAYGVVTALDGLCLALTALFAPRVMHSELRLGTFTDAWEGLAPAVTIECGQAGTLEADATAHAGLVRFLELPTLDPHQVTSPMAVFVSPVRMKLRPGLGLAFADRPIAAVDVVLHPALDSLNFLTVARDQPIGLVGDEAAAGQWPFEAHDERGRECSREYLTIDGGVIRAARSFVPIMATTDVRIAIDDCLFYAATQRE